jgi:hypothetical protein
VKTITKRFTKLRQAENYQNRLYFRYERVRLVRSPRFSEDGIYAWEVVNKPAPVATAS